MRYGVLMSLVVTLVLQSGCVTKAVLEESAAAFLRSAAAAEDGVAGVSSQAQKLLATVDHGVAASSSETLALMIETRALIVETTALLATARGQIAANGSATATLADALSSLATTLKDGIAANASSARATTAAIASTTRELDAMLSDLRPNLVAASAELAPTLVNIRETTAKVSERAGDPLISDESRWLLRIVLGAVALLLGHAVWSTLNLRRVVSGVLEDETEEEPPEEG